MRRRLGRPPASPAAHVGPTLTLAHPCLVPCPCRSWLANLAAAADAVGVPLCVSLAVVDPSTGEASNSKEFHTGA